MKPLCCKNSLLALFLVLLVGLLVYLVDKFLTSNSPKSAIVYYAKLPSLKFLDPFDIAIVEADNLNFSQKDILRYQDKLFAYVSLGESEPSRTYFKNLDKTWFIGTNDLWQSHLLDIKNPHYQQFLLQYVLKDLTQRGYQNFFFDTVDAYQHIASTKTERKSYEEALVRFFQTLKKSYPKSKVIINRGFELIDQIYPYIDGVLFESLFFGLDPKDLSYRKIPKNDRLWLMKQVQKIQTYHLPIIVVDYLPPNQQQKAKEDAKAIAKLELIPYITDRYLHTIGTSMTKNPASKGSTDE